MRHLAWLFTFVLIGGPVFADNGPATNAADQAPSAALYKALVAQAHNGQTDIDYTALRLSYAQTADYDPWGTSTQDLFNAIWTAKQKGDCGTVLKNSDALLAIDFTPVPIHVMRQGCFDKAGDKEHAAQELAIGRGLVNSLMSSGNGKSPQSAYVVISLKEEGLALVLLELTEKGQALVRGPDHMYDLLECADDKTGEKVSVYFQIDNVWAGEARMLKPLDKAH